MSANGAGRACLLTTVAGVLTAALLILPEPAAAETGNVHEYVAVRTTTAPTSMELDIGVPEGFAYNPAFVGAVGAVVDHGTVVGVVPGFTERYNGRPDPLIAAEGTSVSGCSAGMCHLSGTAVSADILTYQDNGGPGGMNRLYLVVEGPRPRVTLKGDGWVLQLADFAYRYVDGATSGDASVYAAQMGVELFRAATLPGGSAGSIAEAAPPCSGGAIGGGVPVQAGVGQVSLSGGKTSPSVTCPSQTSTFFADWADGPTQWSLSGVAVGNATLQEVRLFVVDQLPTTPSTPMPSSTPAARTNPTAAPAGTSVSPDAAPTGRRGAPAVGLPMTSAASSDDGAAPAYVAALVPVGVGIARRRRRTASAFVGAAR